MSSYSLSNSAPINNVPYYNAPVYTHQQHNQPSYRKVNNQHFNHQVGDSYNSNNHYEIYQTQSYPSSSLFDGQNQDNTYGYTSNNGVRSGSLIQYPKQNQMHLPNQVYAIENFENSNAEMDMERNANRLDNSKSMKETPVVQHQNQYYPPQQQQQQQQQIVYNNQYVPTQPMIQQNDYNYNYNHSPDYLNVGSIPNIAGLYNQIQHRPIEKIIVKEASNDRETKITDLDIDKNSDSDDDDDDDDVKETKISKIKKKINKKKKQKKKKDKMIYLVIFLLSIIIGLILYILLNPKAKRVRF